MRHYGDITKISGYDVPPVDVITGGSPCQDLSIAGRRAGLDGERSGLFMEQIRIIREMRSRYVRIGGSNQLVRLPRYVIWENVPGAFSSNGGKDFQAVLTEFVRVAEPDAPDVPMPEKGRWPKAGCLYDDLGQWSVAWRVHDAQFWGVPQRRKRIAAVCDFGGLSAPEVLFERKGLSGDTQPRRAQGQETAGPAGVGVESAEPILLESNQNHATVQMGGVSTTLPASMGMGGGYVPMVAAAHPPTIIFENHGQDSRYKPLGDTCETVNAKYGTGGNNQPLVVCIGNGQAHIASHLTEEVSQTLNCMHDPMAILYTPDVAHSLKATANCQYREDSETYVAAVDCRNGTENAEIDGTLQAKGNGGTSVNLQNTCRVGSAVRRLTPDECASLQGFPRDWCNIGEWTDSKGKRHKDADSPKYKAYGNSIAVGYANGRSGFWCWLARRICAQYERQITMASLFDGIGGFPLAFQAAGAIPVWASEIEEFPIAVTKYHFPEEADHDKPM